jgi:hypothetical protein
MAYEVTTNNKPRIELNNHFFAVHAKVSFQLIPAIIYNIQLTTITIATTVPIKVVTANTISLTKVHTLGFGSDFLIHSVS